MRTVNIHIVPARQYVLTFRPDSGSLGDDTLLVSSEYEVTTDSSGVGSVELPVPATGSVRYSFHVINGNFEGSFYLGAGPAVNLEDLIALGGTSTDQTINDYIDNKIAEEVAAAVGGLVPVSPL